MSSFCYNRSNKRSLSILLALTYFSSILFTKPCYQVSAIRIQTHKMAHTKREAILDPTSQYDEPDIKERLAKRWSFWHSDPRSQAYAHHLRPVPW